MSKQINERRYAYAKIRNWLISTEREVIVNYERKYINTKTK